MSKALLETWPTSGLFNDPMGSGDETTGQRIRRLRQERRLTQEKLAQKLGVSKETIRLWEGDRNKPGMDNLSSLVAVFSVAPSDIIAHVAPQSLVERDDLYASLDRFLDRQGRAIEPDDLEWLVSQRFSGGDPGDDWWPDALLLHQRHKIRKLREQRPNLADPALQPGGVPLKPRKP